MIRNEHEFLFVAKGEAFSKKIESHVSVKTEI